MFVFVVHDLLPHKNLLFVFPSEIELQLFVFPMELLFVVGLFFPYLLIKQNLDGVHLH